MKTTYEFGDAVTADVRLIGPGGRVETDVMSRASLKADLVFGREGKATTVDLARTDESHVFTFAPVEPGEYTVRFTAYVRDHAGHEILPRPGVTYRFELLPKFYVSPDRIDFGDVSDGDTLPLPVNIHCGLPHGVTITVTSGLDDASTASFRKRDTALWPRAVAPPVSAAPTTVMAHDMAVAIPEDAEWGDYEGWICFQTDSGEQYKVAYTLHVLSFWEKIQKYVLFVVILALIVLGVLVYLWGFLDSPRGVLIVEGSSVMQAPIRLGEVRRGIFSRWFHWRRNRLSIRRRGGNISLADIPPGMSAELAFRFGRKVYLRNTSLETSDHLVVIEEPGLSAPIRRRPGHSLSLRHRSLITMGKVKLRYER